MPTRAHVPPPTSYFSGTISAKLRSIAEKDIFAHCWCTAVRLPIWEAFFAVIVDMHELLVSPHAIAHLPEPAFVAATVNFVDVEA